MSQNNPIKPQTAIQLAIADDHELFRDGLTAIINSFKNCEVTFNAPNGKELIEMLSVAAELPDICILDINMPVLNGYKTLREIKSKWPQLKVIIVTMHTDKFVTQRVSALGADGYLIKNCNPRELEAAIKEVAIGGVYFYNPENKTNDKKKDKQAFRHLTEREIEFLKLCCTALSYKEIAVKMEISIRTIHSYQSSISEKFKIKTRTQLAMFAKESGLA